MYTVYLIQSINFPDKKYTGFTTNFKKRFDQHNSGKVSFTKNAAPWEVKVLVNFKDENKAKDFEAYLKHGSGHAFVKRHFW